MSAGTWLSQLLLAVSLSGTLLAQTVPAGKAFRVTLLGTGAPRPSFERFGPSTLVEAGNQKLLFDVGRGATIRLWQLPVPLGEVKAVFVTHLHSDHVNGLSDLWLTGWLPTPFGGRTQTFRVFGPLGTREMMSHLEQAHQADIRFRMADDEEHHPASGIATEVTEIEEGVAYENDGVRVTAFGVDHGDVIKPALGYRVDYQGRSVVISGDTRFSTNLIKYARGATVIIHEVAAAQPEVVSRSKVLRRILAHHSSPEDAARVFANVAPRLAIFSHVVLLGEGQTPAPTLNELVRRTRTVYAGPLEVGSDLMTIEIDDEPRVMPRDSAGR